MRRAPRLLMVLAACALPVPGLAACSFTQTCTTENVDDPTCTPVGKSQPAFVPDFGGDALSCPQYANKTCCSRQQNALLASNFALITAEFGYYCSACAANTIAFWCAVTCSPDQAEFVEYLRMENVTDPQNSGAIALVDRNRITLNDAYVCALYDSCKDVPFVKQFAPMSTASGFLATLAQTYAIAHGT